MLGSVVTALVVTLGLVDVVVDAMALASVVLVTFFTIVTVVVTTVVVMVIVVTVVTGGFLPQTPKQVCGISGQKP